MKPKELKNCDFTHPPHYYRLSASRCCSLVPVRPMRKRAPENISFAEMLACENAGEFVRVTTTTTTDEIWPSRWARNWKKAAKFTNYSGEISDWLWESQYPTRSIGYNLLEKDCAQKYPSFVLARPTFDLFVISGRTLLSKRSPQSRYSIDFLPSILP